MKLALHFFHSADSLLEVEFAPVLEGLVTEEQLVLYLAWRVIGKSAKRCGVEGIIIVEQPREGPAREHFHKQLIFNYFYFQMPNYPSLQDLSLEHFRTHSKPLYRLIYYLNSSERSSDDVQQYLALFPFFQEIFEAVGGCPPSLHKCLKLKFMPRGKILFLKGDIDNSLYIILKGQMLALVKRVNQQQVESPKRRLPDLKGSRSRKMFDREQLFSLVIDSVQKIQEYMPDMLVGSRYQEGLYFGQESLIKCQRKGITMVSAQDTYLMVLSKLDFDKHLGVKMLATREAQRYQFLKQVKFFDSWEGKYQQLMQLFQRKVFSFRDLVYSQGSESDCLYLLKTGQVNLSVNHHGQEFVYLKVCCPSIFGEEQLFDCTPRRTKATIASASAEVYSIESKKLPILFAYPDVKFKISQCLRKRKNLKQNIINTTRNCPPKTQETINVVSTPTKSTPSRLHDNFSPEFSMLQSNPRHFNQTAKKYRAKFKSFVNQKDHFRPFNLNIIAKKLYIHNNNQRVPKTMLHELDLEIFNWHQKLGKDRQWSGNCRPKTSSVGYRQKQRYFKYMQQCLRQQR